MPPRRSAARSVLFYTFPVLASLASPALARWTGEPVQVRATLAACPLVAATSDGRGGAIVMWQEGSAATGVLQAERITASGDLGTWPNAPVTFCAIDAPRHALGAVSDDEGGAFVWWMESSALYLTRLTPDGFIAEGWAARGVHLGDLPDAEHRPVLKRDGQGGVYVGWIQARWLTLQVMRFGSDGLPAGGWPAEGRTFALSPVANFVVRSFGFSPTPEGGLWVAGQTTDGSFYIGPDAMPGVLMVQRLDPSGVTAPGWESGALGVVFVAPAGGMPPSSRNALVALEGDGSGGVFIVSVDPERLAQGTLLRPRLMRLAADGSPATGWTYEGLELASQLVPRNFSASPDASVFTMAAPDGGLYVGLPEFASVQNPRMYITRHSASGAELPGTLLIDQAHIDTAPRSDGGLFAAACRPSGPRPGFEEPPARVGLWQSPTGASFIEDQGTSPDSFYDDVGVASTDDGEAILAWAQHLGRQGVFAVRVGPDGLVTEIPPPPSPPVMRIWYASGAGVRVTGSSGHVRLSLHDLTGREVARGESSDVGDWTVPGTAGLPSGMYFAKAVAEGQERTSKVMVIR